MSIIILNYLSLFQYIYLKHTFVVSMLSRKTKVAYKHKNFKTFSAFILHITLNTYF